MNYSKLKAPWWAPILLCALALAALPSVAAAQCNCTNSSLLGDTVSTTVAGPAVNSMVTGGVELPAAGPALGLAGASPRFKIDFGANTIRVEAVLQAATYGGAIKFHFNSLNPIAPANCAAASPTIVGIVVTTNKPNGAFIVSGATFTANSVTVPIAPATGANIDWMPGEFVNVVLRYACEGGTTTPAAFDSCCPPWNSTQLMSRLAYQGSTIGQPYTLKFQNTAPLNAQMNAYITYLQSLGLGFTNITINFGLFNHGTNATPNPTGTQVGLWTPMTWPGAPVANFFPNGAMQVGVWYRIRTKITLSGGPANWLSEKCLESYVDVRVQAIAGLRAASPGEGQAGSAMLQFRTPDGKVTERPIQLGAGGRDN